MPEREKGHMRKRMEMESLSLQPRVVRPSQVEQRRRVNHRLLRLLKLRRKRSSNLLSVFILSEGLVYQNMYRKL